jgi:hypothetical protein
MLCESGLDLESDRAFQRGEICQQIIPRLALELVGILGPLAIVLARPCRQLHIVEQPDHDRIRGMQVGAQIGFAGFDPRGATRFAHLLRSPWTSIGMPRLLQERLDTNFARIQVHGPHAPDLPGVDPSIVLHGRGET